MKTTAFVLAAALMLTACGSSSTATTAATTTSDPASTTAASTAAEDVNSTTNASGESSQTAQAAQPVAIENIFEYVTLGEYKNLEVPYSESVITDEDVLEFVENLLENESSYEHITEGEVKDGDTAGIYFVGTLDGVAFEGGTGSYELKIGSGSFIDGFEEGLIGAKVGETVDLNLTFPDPYPNNTDLSGAAVVFTVTVNYILGTEMVTPEYTDELAQEYGFADMEEMNADIKAYLQEEADADNATAFTDAAWETAVNNATILKNHDELLNYYYNAFVDEYTYTASSYGLGLSEFISLALGVTEEEFEKAAVEYSEFCMAQELVCRAIVETEGFTVTEEEYQNQLELYFAEYSYYFDSVERLEAYFGRDRLETDLLWAKALDLVQGSAVSVPAE